MVCEKTAEYGTKHEQVRLVGPGFVAHKVDKKIAKFIDALWDKGVETFASCEDSGFLVRQLLDCEQPDYPVAYVGTRNSHMEKAILILKDCGARIETFLSGPAQGEDIAIIEFTYQEE